MLCVRNLHRAPRSSEVEHYSSRVEVAESYKAVGIMNKWLETIHDYGFTASINIDDEPVVTLHYFDASGPKQWEFTGNDVDSILQSALEFAESYFNFKGKMGGIEEYEWKYYFGFQ